MPWVLTPEPTASRGLRFPCDKQHRHLKHFLGNRGTTVKAQVGCAIATCVHIALAKKTFQLDASLSTCARSCRSRFWRKTSFHAPCEPTHRHSIQLAQLHHTGIEWHLLNLMGMAITSQAVRAQWREGFDLRQSSSCTATGHPMAPGAAAWLGSRDGLPAVWRQRIPGAIEGGRKMPGNYVGRPAVAAPLQRFFANSITASPHRHTASKLFGM